MSINRSTLFFGDNLRILINHIDDNSVDLIYLDPPFNSKTSYNVLFEEPTGDKSKAQIEAFDDTWHWTEESERAFTEIVDKAPSEVVDMILAFRKFIKQNDVMAYITMMTIRLLELHRVLKSTGTLYLHCDPTASHYLKIVMDTIFGVKNFMNEVVWVRNSGSIGRTTFSKRHDILLVYNKSENYFYDGKAVGDLREQNEGSFGGYFGTDPDGRRYREVRKAGKIYKYYMDEPRNPNDVWIVPQIPERDKTERLGYNTQKPRKLLERIIKASCPKNGIVLDPFCGCGTTLSACEYLNQKEGYNLTWLGIDVTHLAINLMKYRLKNEYNLEQRKNYDVVGEPEDLQGAIELAQRQDRYDFQYWALSLVNARPYADKKRGADTGIDGYIYFVDPNKPKEYQNAIVQVKSGGVQAKDIRELKAVIEREKALIGIFLTLEESTRNMREEAIQSGFYKTGIPKIQILTVKDILENGRKPNIPLQLDYRKKAERIEINKDNLSLFD